MVLVLSGLVGSVLLACGAGFVAWWVGPAQYLGDEALWGAVAVLGLRHWLNAVAVTLFCLNRERQRWLLTLLDGLITLAATIAWVRWGGPSFAPLGSLVALTVVTLPALLFVLFREGTLSARAVLGPVAVWAVLYVALAIAAAALGRATRPESLPALAAVASGVSFAYAAVMIGPMMRSHLGYYLRPRLRQWSARLGRPNSPGN